MNHVPNILNQSKIIWIVQNCFGPIAGQGINKKYLFFQTEDEDKDEQIKRECEKIFHPEKFEFHDLTTSLPTIETPNIDWWVMAFLTRGYKVNIVWPSVNLIPTGTGRNQPSHCISHDNNR